jgi:hypothetical protein
VAAAEAHAGAEKRFVDRLVGANAGVIDLEMGLPTGEVTEGKRKSAPRMDLVVAQPTEGNSYSIGFWEAKCSINSELRAEAEYVENENGDYEKGPKVIHHLRKYQEWVKDDKRRTEIQNAYKATAKVLLGLYDVFGTKFDPEPECVHIWQALKASCQPKVIMTPGVVVGNYCPIGHKPSKTGDELIFERRARSFGSHRDKLRRHGVTIHEVGADQSDHILPMLSAGEVAA